ncbi:MAG TPA: hypothetical protein VHZ29_15195 [Rhizomicrobium sp.]|jgi:hypothetical protein|nr:hypothetical protein [Rhizomicrobium sp.]
MRCFSTIAVAACLLSGAAGAATDGNYTLFTPGDALQSLTWSACSGGGCFTSGEIGPFKRICAVMEGKPRHDGNLETRAIYVVDKARRSPSATLHLFVYTRTDTFSESGDQVQVVERADLDTHVDAHGIGNDLCTVAGNDNFLFVGLSGGGAVMVDERRLTMASPGDLVSSITADDRGNVTLGTVNGEFQTYDRQGFLMQSGSGPRFATDTKNAFVFP